MKTSPAQKSSLSKAKSAVRPSKRLSFEHQVKSKGRFGSSISWTAESLKLCHAHMEKLGMDRSAYLRALIEHASGFRLHPQLTQRLSVEEIAKALD